MIYNCSWCDEEFEPRYNESKVFCCPECKAFDFKSGESRPHPLDTVPEDVKLNPHTGARKALKKLVPDGFSTWTT